MKNKKTVYILGISCYYHDSAATLIKDGMVVAAAEEERFTRKKHDNSFPINAVNYCLASQNISINDIDYIGFYEKPFLKFERLLHQHLEMFPYSLKTFLKSMPKWINERLRILRTIKKKLKYKGDVLFVEHHLAHAASAFLISPFNKAAILTADGVGEWTTTSYGLGEDNNINLMKEIKFPSSLGLLYSTITAYLGFSVNNSEYKCLHPDTDVLFSNGDLIRIENLFDLPGKKIKISSTEELKKLNSKLELVSLDKEKLKLVNHGTNVVYRKKVDTLLYELELISGRKVTVTPNHKFTSVTSFADIFSIEAENIRKNDFIAIARKLKHQGSFNKINLYWAKLLAYSITEGHELLRKSKNEAEIRIGITNKPIFDDIKNLISLLGKKYRTWNLKSRKNMYYIGISVWRDLNFFKSLGYDFGGRAGSKEIPRFIFVSDKNIQKQFLSVLFDCDGSFTRHQIIYTTKSKRLSEQILYLLLNFGIHSRVRKVLNKKYNIYYYRLEINGINLKLFDEEIGFCLKQKSKKLKDYISSVDSFGNNVDFIPINDYVLNKWISSGYNKKDLYREIKYHFWDYETKKRYVTQRLLERLDKKLADKQIKKFMNSDIYFDRVKSIKKIKFKGYVYDVLMPKHHTFVGGSGGIILHNTMGLAAYGMMNREKNPFYKRLKQVIDVKEDGSYRMDMRYFIYHFSDRMPSQRLCRFLGSPIKNPKTEITQRHKDIAAALQLILEDIMTKLLVNIHNELKCDNLVLAGGVALNSVYNGKILGSTPFKKIWIQPNATDGGASMGVASYIYNSILGYKRNYQLKNPYLGPKFSTKDIKLFLDNNKIKYHEFKSSSELIKKTANLIFESNVVGWFHEGMEWGPRALGARSILSNPCDLKMQEILNLKVKHRENFRPFAPVVCEDDALKYFECDKPIPEPTDYMLMVYPIKKEWHKLLPAVTHVDGSGRLQTIRRHQNSIYYDLIKQFGKLSGMPILINTSFNIRGEPIVCTPYDAYKCMMGTGIDYLIMDKFLIKRDDNPQDMWDSEANAND